MLDFKVRMWTREMHLQAGNLCYLAFQKAKLLLLTSWITWKGTGISNGISDSWHLCCFLHMPGVRKQKQGDVSLCNGATDHQLTCSAKMLSRRRKKSTDSSPSTPIFFLIVFKSSEIAGCSWASFNFCLSGNWGEKTNKPKAVHTLGFLYLSLFFFL